MSAPVAPPPPVNAIISIQPITTAIPSAGNSIPPQIAALPPGTNVHGFVINRDSKNNPILRTSLGDVLVQSDVFIRTGSEVVFRVDTSQAARARIITIDGLIPEDYVGQSAPLIVDDIIEQPTLISLPAEGDAPPAPGTTTSLEALVLKPLLTRAPTAAGTPTPPLATGNPMLAQLQLLEPGQPLKITVLSAALPPPPVSLTSLAEPLPHLQQLVANQFALLAAEPTGPAPTPAPPPQPLAANPPRAGEATPPPLPLPTAATTLPPLPAIPPAAAHTPLLAQEVSQPHSPATPAAPYGAHFAPATHASASPATTAAASTITVTATVIGHEGDGATILQTPFATLKLYTQQPLLHGTELKLAVTVEKPVAFTPLPLTEGSTAGTLARVTHDWQELAETLAQLQTTQPQAWADITRSLPTADNRLASSLLFFLAAVKGPDSKQWLSARALEALETISPALLGRMGENMAELKQLFTPQPGTNWTSVMLPIYYSGELQPAHLHLRHEEEPEEKSGARVGGGGQRFVVEVDLSQLGAMQFDGFVRGEKQQRQLDLVVRGARPLPDAVVQGIRTTFTTALQVTGIQGQVLFQTGAQHFVRPLAERNASSTAAQANTILA